MTCKTEDGKSVNEMNNKPFAPPSKTRDIYKLAYVESVEATLRELVFAGNELCGFSDLFLNRKIKFPQSFFKMRKITVM